MHDPNAYAFGLSRVFRLARKELREILRDRRTILTLVAMNGIGLRELLPQGRVSVAVAGS